MKHTDGKRQCVNDPSPEREPRVIGYSAVYGPIYRKGGGTYMPRRSHGYSAKYGELEPGVLRRLRQSESKQKQQKERLDS